MTKNSSPPDDSWESDAVWDLIDRSPAQPVSPRFADDTLRAVRLSAEETPWWKSIFSRPAAVGLLGATAALALTASVLWKTPDAEIPTPVVNDSPNAESLATIQDIAEAEVLLAAEHLDDFSDHELASLAGF